jgi:type II secretory pathway pseudopilin PulG
MLEILVATVLASLVIVGAVVIFIGGVRLSLGMQARSHALRKGSTSIDRMRQGLEEATAILLPEDAAPLLQWPSALLGNRNQYQVTQNGVTLNTGLYISETGTKSLPFRTSATQVSSLTTVDRKKATRGALLYRGDALGTPNPSQGTFLWQWSYENGVVVSKTLLYRKLSTQWDAVAFRRGSQSGQVLRYRLVLTEKDSYQQESSALGSGPESDLDASDYAITLLNHAGEGVPTTALPLATGGHP